MQGRHRKPPDFDVHYTIDAYGNRLTSGDYEMPKILFLGGSLTFGHGVNDDEFYAQLLQKKFNGYKVVNAASNAWGTTQAYLKINDLLSAYDDIQLVIYGFINHHVKRNYLRDSWLSALARSNRKNPHFEINDGSIEFHGLADPLKDGLVESKELNETERQITLRLIREIRRLCSQHSIPFIFLHLPDTENGPLDSALSDIISPTEYIDLRPRIDTFEIRFKYDKHPTAEGHRLIAQELETLLRERLPDL
jgi:lysophospholipase L1-like esterase